MPEMMGRERSLFVNTGVPPEIGLADESGGFLLEIDDIDGFLANWDNESLRVLCKEMLKALMEQGNPFHDVGGATDHTPA